MASRCEEEFNPWPSFVDIFSSVILVMLLFLLVLLVNLGFYAQFKYKVSYTGSISSDDVILNDNPQEVKIDKIIEKSQTQTSSQVETIKQQEEIIKSSQKEVLRLRKIIEERLLKSVNKDTADIEAGGIDVKDRKDDDRSSKQVIFENAEYFIVTFKKNEIFFDNAITKKLKAFIAQVKIKYKKHKIVISASDIEGQISATVSKQISLARSIGARNLIRKLGYKKKDVRIDLLGSTEVKENVNKKHGYLIIRVKK